MADPYIEPSLSIKFAEAPGQLLKPVVIAVCRTYVIASIPNRWYRQLIRRDWSSSADVSDRWRFDLYMQRKQG
jgi:hypothetical protein